MARLRSPNGCPWDREQDHKSLRWHAVEEVYELLDAIEAQDDHEMAEELGDLLLQVVFHCQLANERGAKLAKMLPVSAPFHCSLMKPAQDRLAADLHAMTFLDPAVPVACNVDAELVEDADRSRDALIRQVTGSVKWEQGMRLLITKGVQAFVEVGPGRVLCGLMRQIERSKTCLTVGDEPSLQKTLEQLAKVKA